MSRLAHTLLCLFWYFAMFLIFLSFSEKLLEFFLLFPQVYQMFSIMILSIIWDGFAIHTPLFVLEMSYSSIWAVAWGWSVTFTRHTSCRSEFLKTFLLNIVELCNVATLYHLQEAWSRLQTLVLFLHWVWETKFKWEKYSKHWCTFHEMYRSKPDMSARDVST